MTLLLACDQVEVARTAPALRGDRAAEGRGADTLAVVWAREPVPRVLLLLHCDPCADEAGRRGWVPALRLLPRPAARTQVSGK